MRAPPTREQGILTGFLWKLQSQVLCGINTPTLLQASIRLGGGRWEPDTLEMSLEMCMHCVPRPVLGRHLETSDSGQHSRRARRRIRGLPFYRA